MIVYLVNRNSKFKGPYDIIDSNRQHIIKVGDICLRDTINGLAFLVVINSDNFWNACKCIGLGSNSETFGLDNTLLFSFDGLHKRIGNIPLIDKLSGCFREKVIVDFFYNAIDILEYKTDFWDASLFMQFFASSQTLLDNKKEVITRIQTVSVYYPTHFAQYLSEDLLQVLNEIIAQGKSLREGYEFIRDQSPSSFRKALMTFLYENPGHTIYEKLDVTIEPEKIEPEPASVEIQHEVVSDEFDSFRLSNDKKQELNILFNRYHKGDKIAFDKIVQDNQKLVAVLAKRYKGRGMDYEDLMQEGTIGLIKAIDHYDETYNVEFGKYAQWWILQAITNALANLSHIIRLPQNVMKCHVKVWNFVKKYEQQHEIPPSINEINIDENDRKKIYYVYHLPSNIKDLTSLVEDLDIFECDSSAFERYEDKEYNKYIANLYLNSLSSRSKRIVKSYYGIGCLQESLEEIGKGLNLTRERVRQILEKSIKILRERAPKHEIIDIKQSSAPLNIVESFDDAEFGAYIEVPEANQMAKIIDIQFSAGAVKKIVLKMGLGELFYYTPDGILIPVSRKNNSKMSPEREAFLQEMESQRQNAIEIASELQTPKKDVQKQSGDNFKGRKSIVIKGERTLITKECGERDAYKTKGTKLVNNLSIVDNKNDNTTNIIDTDVLRHVFLNTSATYKFYWFISILQLLQNGHHQKIMVYDIVARMVANAWIPLICHNLEFGRSDSLKAIVADIQRYDLIPVNVNVDQIFAILERCKKEYRIKRLLRVMTWNVPYRFLSPWINSSDNKDLMCRSQRGENGCLYSLYMDESEPYILLNPNWMSYLLSHHEELLAFSYQSLSTFLLPKNPKITNIEEIITLYDNTYIEEGSNNQINNEDSIDDLEIEHVNLDEVYDGTINIEKGNVPEYKDSELEFNGAELAKRFYYPAQDLVFWDCNHQVYEIYLVDNYDLVINHLLFDYDELLSLEKKSESLSDEAKEELFSEYWDNNHINVIARINPGSDGYEMLVFDNASIKEINYIKGRYTSIKLVDGDETKYFDYNGSERESLDNIVNNVISDVAKYHDFYDAPYYVIKEYIRFGLYEIKYIYKGTVKKVTIYADSELGKVIKENSEEIWRLDEALILTKSPADADNVCPLKMYFINGVEVIDGDFDAVRAKSVILQNQLKERTTQLWKTFKKKKDFIRYGRQIKEIAATLFEYAEETDKENENFPTQKEIKVDKSDVIKVVETRNSDDNDERNQSIDDLEIEHVYLDNKGNVIKTEIERQKAKNSETESQDGIGTGK